MIVGTEENGNSTDNSLTINGTAAQKLLFLRGSICFLETKLH